MFDNTMDTGKGHKSEGSARWFATGLLFGLFVDRALETIEGRVNRCETQSSGVGCGVGCFTAPVKIGSFPASIDQYGAAKRVAFHIIV